MNEQVVGSDDTQGLKARILENPNAVLDDGDVLARLLEASGHGVSSSRVVDMRSVLADRMNARLAEVEAAHQETVSAAFELVNSFHQIHRLVLRLMEANTLSEFLDICSQDAAPILNVDQVWMCLEVEAAQAAPHSALIAVEPGYIQDYFAARYNGDGSRRQVALGPSGDGSEAAIKLDLGPDFLPAMLVIESRDAKRFTKDQGSDLLQFLGRVVSLMLGKWLI